MAQEQPNPSNVKTIDDLVKESHRLYHTECFPRYILLTNTEFTETEKKRLSERWYPLTMEGMYISYDTHVIQLQYRFVDQITGRRLRYVIGKIDEMFPTG